MRRLLVIWLGLCALVGAPAFAFPGPQDDPPVEETSDDATASVADAASEVATEVLEDPAGFVQKWLERGKAWAVAEGPGLLGKVALFLALVLAAKIIAGAAAGIVRKTLSTSKLEVSDLLRTFAINTTRKAIVFLGLLFALAAVGVPIGPFLAAFGVVGFVVGFALQDTMGNFAAGVMILLYRPYDVGDVVTAGGITGKVHEMNLVSTTLVTPDNQTNVVPNGSIWGGVITNVTANSTRRVDLTAAIGYGDDIAKAEEVLGRIVGGHELAHAQPAPVIKVHELGASSVNFVVRVWTNTTDYWDLYWDLTRAIKVEFDKEGISIPYPQQDVHMYQADGVS